MSVESDSSRPPVKKQRLNDDVEAAAAHSLVHGLEKQHYLHATASDDWEWLPAAPDSAEGVLRFGTATPVPAELLGRWTGTSGPAVPKAAAAREGAEVEGVLRWAYGGRADLPSAGASQAALVRTLAVERSLSAFANTERAGVSESVAFVLAIVAGGALASMRGVYRGPSPDASEVTYFALLPRVPEVAAVRATSDAVVSAIIRSVQTGVLGNQREAIERYLRTRGFALEAFASDRPSAIGTGGDERRCVEASYYRSIPCDSCSHFDSLALTSLRSAREGRGRRPRTAGPRRWGRILPSNVASMNQVA